MRKLKLLGFIIVIACIIYVGAILAIPEVYAFTRDGIAGISKGAADVFAAVTTPIATSPIYLQWSWLIWLGIGWFTLGIGMMVWHRRSQLKTVVKEKVYQHELSAGLPQTATEQVTQPAALPPKEVKKEEAVAE